MKKQFASRMLSLLLSAAMVLGMLPAVAPHVHAAETPEWVADYTVETTCGAEGTVLGTFKGSSACVREADGWLHICSANFPHTATLVSIEEQNKVVPFYDAAVGFVSESAADGVVGFQIYSGNTTKDDTKPNTLQGIQYFTEITGLEYDGSGYCGYSTGPQHTLRAIDLSKNTKLKKLIILFANMEGIDLSHTHLLEHIEFAYSAPGIGTSFENYANEYKRIRNLDLTHLDDLSYLRIEDEDIVTLDLSENTKLHKLYLKNNKKLTTQPELPQSGILEIVDFTGNGFTALDMGEQTGLKNLYANRSGLTSIDVTGCPELYDLYVSNNSLTKLDVTGNTKLHELYCQSNLLTGIDLSKNTALVILDASGNRMTSLDLHGRTYISPSNDGAQEYTIERVVDDRLDLKTLPAGFDLSKVVVRSNESSPSYQFRSWSNNISNPQSEFLSADENGVLTLPNPNNPVVDYEYDHGGLGYLKDDHMTVELEIKAFCYTVSCETEGVSLPEFNYSSPLGADVTAEPVKRNTSLDFVVELKDGYTESADGIEVFYEMGDGERTAVNSYDWDGQTYYVSPYITAPTRIYVTGVEEAVDGHVHRWSWVDDENGETHTRTCADETCTVRKTEAHQWNSGVTTAATCTEGGYTLYTCTVCGAEKRANETEPAGHDWSDWNYDYSNPEAHSRYCRRSCGIEDQHEVHDWSDWVGEYDYEHTRACAGCDYNLYEAHEWDSGVLLQKPTCTEVGQVKYTCTVCGYERISAYPATGHTYGDNNTCTNCGHVRVYHPISTLEAFDQLSEDASYIVVFKDSDKTYAAALASNPCETDSDGDGIVDAVETDENGNGVPDCIELMYKQYNGEYSCDEDDDIDADDYALFIGDYDGDEDMDADDYALFIEDRSYTLGEMYMSAQNNFVEVTLASDGTITLSNEGAMELQMMPGGIWGGEPYDEETFANAAAEYGVDTETERIRAAWVPNYWVGINSNNLMGIYSYSRHFYTEPREYGDETAPGANDAANWKIGFREDGSLSMIGLYTYDYNDSTYKYDDTAALQLVKYSSTSEGGGDIYEGDVPVGDVPDSGMTIVAAPESEWEYSDIVNNATEKLPAYLFASEPVSVCNHIWGNWENDDVAETHTRRCTVDGCNAKQTETHKWDNGVETKAPTCTEAGVMTYTCTEETCGATKTESVDALDHDWSDWTYDSVDSHIRSCKRNCGVEQEIGGHKWGDWVPVNDTTHKMVCDLCTGEQTGEHDWDNGAITKEPSEYEAGVTTYTCQTCGHTRTEPIDKLPHEHTWTDWEPDGDENHKRTCMDEACATVETVPHNWDEGKVTTEPNCTAAGVKTYTCQTCSHTKTEEIPENGHRYESTVIQAPSCTVEGLMTQYCPVCGDTKEKTMPVDPDAHDWGEWSVTKRPTYTEAGEEQRICNLNSEHVQTREIASLVCYHTCAACGGCTAELTVCARTLKCGCSAAVCDKLEIVELNDQTISFTSENIPVDVPVSIVAVEVQLPSVTDNTASQEVVNPYEEFILNNAEGMKVETVFEIGLVNEETGAAYELKEGESATVTLFVGPENAEAIEDGRMFLVHITNGTQIIYGADEIVAELEGESYTGNIIFTTDSFSPFVLVSLPGGLDITLNGVGATNSCTVSISANQAFNCSLYLAAYDSNGKMLAVKVVDSCNLAAHPQYTLEFSGTTSYVKAFMLKPDGSLIPCCNAETDNALND